ncbi:hypothetical protein BpHYR1_052759 [Brachionus plicatilis]|uniref:Uncharacterized protein n=1 Tax=Brachionus plicatilis TaxID=10195 RepID=A0A3M7PAS7_BRAPC|nr:hypothetical protein BpHYR1_052759 [Brachionus plicatilis]
MSLTCQCCIIFQTRPRVNFALPSFMSFELILINRILKKISVLFLLTDSTPVSTLKRRKKIEPRSWVWQGQNVAKIISSDKCNICQQVINIYNSSTIELFLILPEVENNLNQMLTNSFPVSNSRSLSKMIPSFKSWKRSFTGSWSI